MSSFRSYNRERPIEIRHEQQYSCYCSNHERCYLPEQQSAHCEANDDSSDLQENSAGSLKHTKQSLDVDKPLAFDYCPDVRVRDLRTEDKDDKLVE